MDFYISTIKLLGFTERGSTFQIKIQIFVHSSRYCEGCNSGNSSTAFKKATTGVVLYIVTSNVLISNSVVMISMHNNIQTLYPRENLLQITSPIFFITHSLLTSATQSCFRLLVSYPYPVLWCSRVSGLGMRHQIVET